MESGRDIFHLLLTAYVTTVAGSGPSRMWKSHAAFRSPMQVAGTTYLDHLLLPSQVH